MTVPQAQARAEDADRSPMRVLQVHTRYRGRGGEDSVLENEAGLLEEAGHEVRLFEGRNAETAAEAAA